MEDFRRVRAANLALLGLLAALVLALALGAAVPRWSIAAVFVVHAGLRLYRVSRWGGGTGAGLVSFALSLVLAGLILFSG